jgi:hypothetical protein
VTRAFGNGHAGAWPAVRHLIRVFGQLIVACAYVMA